MARLASMEELEGRRLLSVASIGLNLDPIYDWGTIAPFNDLGTQFRTWGRPATPYAPDASIPVTKDNYPLADASAITFAYGYPDGRYAVSYDGEGTLSFSMGPATTYAVTSHVGDHWTGVLDLHHDGNFLTMDLSGVNSTNPIHNLHIISPDADPAISETFRPVFLQKLAPFNGPIRTMDWLQTNNNTIVNWVDRTPADRFSYASYDERPGVPYEQVIKLANTLHRDLWFNIPVGATDDFVHNLAALLRDALDPSLKVYVEYSNELWNSLFAQTATNLANARADRTLTASDDFGREAQEAAKRLVQISNIFRGEFGEARFGAQVRAEFGSQAANSYFAKSGLDYVNAQFGDPKNFIAGLAIGDYVGDADSMSSIDNASLTLDGLFAWMNNFVDTTLDFWIKSSKGIADQYGLALEAYEGGQALTAYNGVNAALKLAAQDDPRMGDFYKHLIRNWVGNGGDNFLHYSVAGPWSAGGAWGMLQSIDEARSVKYAALASMVGWGSVEAAEELAITGTATTDQSPEPPAATHTKPVAAAKGGRGFTFAPAPLIKLSSKRGKSRRGLDFDDRWLLDWPD